MLKIFNIFRGSIIVLMLGIGSIIASSIVCINMLLQRLFFKRSRLFFLKKSNRALHYWNVFNNFVFKFFLPTRWIINIPPTMDPEHWYLLIANHRSWTDILILYTVFNKKSDRFAFFLKRELLWLLPIIGTACYLLDFPFLVRHSKKDLRKNPNLKGKDIETTKTACEKFKSSPCTIINFLEGTRFTNERAKRQKSPYKHLLKPKATGVALVLNSMQNHLNSILDVTIRYSTPTPTFWKVISGQVKTIEITARLLPISKEMIGDYYGDRDFRKTLQQYLNHIWSEKDQLLIRQHQKENTYHD